MRLRVHHPRGLFLDALARKVLAEGTEGAFGILPRHQDMAVVLVPGILAYEDEAGAKVYLAVDGGILVKQGGEVLVATKMAVKGELGMLERTVDEMIAVVDDRERRTRSAVARLEAGFVRRFVAFGRNV